MTSASLPGAGGWGDPRGAPAPPCRAAASLRRRTSRATWLLAKAFPACRKSWRRRHGLALASLGPGPGPASISASSQGGMTSLLEDAAKGQCAQEEGVAGKPERPIIAEGGGG